MLIENHRENRTRRNSMRRSRRRWTVLAALGLVLLASPWVFFPSGPRGSRGEPWERWSDAASAGFSEAGLQEVRAYVGTLGTTGLVVLKGGKVLLEYGDIEARGFMAEGRTSVMAMVYGKPVTDGTIDLGLTLEELGIDDRGGLLPVEKQATIEGLLTNRSGVYHPT